jgi:hypothetical protein
VGVVACAVHRGRSDGGQSPVEGGGDLDVHAGIACLAGEQVGDRFPVPCRADRTVYQHCCLTDEIGGVDDELGERLADRGPAQVPPAADRGLADAEERPESVLGGVLADQRHDERDRAEQSQGVGPSGRAQPADDVVYAGGQLGQLPLSPVIASYRNGSSI